MKRIGVFFFLFILLSFSVYALRITPPLTIWEFQPGMKKKVGVAIGSSGNFRQDIEVKAEGDLSKYVTVHKPNVTTPAKGYAGVPITFDFPEKLPPGDNGVKIVAYEAFPPNVTGIIARVSVASVFKARVPYPGKYLKLIDFDAPNFEVNKTGNFVFKIENRGTEVMDKAEGEVEVFDMEGVSVDMVSNTVSDLSSKEKKTLKISWTPDVLPGSYKAEGVVRSSGGTRESEDKFTVGQMGVEILNVSGTRIKKDTIGKILVTIKSLWNAKIDDVYVVLEVLDNKDIIIDEKSNSFSLKAWETKTIPVYLEGNLPEGKYDMKVIVHFRDMKEEKMIAASIVKEKFTIQIIAILIIVILGLLAYYIHRKW